MYCHVLVNYTVIVETMKAAIKSYYVKFLFFQN